MQLVHVSMNCFRFYDQPYVFPCNRFHAGAAAAQQVARELRELADQFERSVVAEAAENLRKSLLTSAIDVSLTCNSESCRIIVLI